MQHVLSISFLTLGAALAQGHSTDQKPGQPPGRPTSDVVQWTAPVHDTTADGSVHTAGADYVARFDASGATFVPFLGAEAERSWPVAFRLTHAHVGELALPVTASAMPRLHDDVVAFDRGCAIEQYVTNVNGFEQRFVFGALPGRGELRLRIGVASELAATLRADGVRFEGPLGGVHYGRATAIDGNGRSVAMTTALADGGLELVVPADFVQTATLPLVVDPVVTTLTEIATGTMPIRNLDAAWDTDLNEWVVVFERVLSATDSDVYVQRVTSSGVALGQPNTIDGSSSIWREPRIANLASSDKFLVVCECVDGANVPWIGGRTAAIVSGSWTFGPQFTIAKSGQNGAPIGPFTNPDVGGDGAATGSGQWVVVYEYGAAPDRDVHLRKVAYDGSVTGAPTLVAATGFDERGPRISKSNGQGALATQRWAIAYERRTSTTTGDAAKLWGALVNRDGSLRNLLGQTTWELSPAIATGRGGWAVSSPTDDVNGARKLMVVESRPMGANGLDLLAIVFSDVGLGGVPTDITMLEPYGATWIAKDQRRPAVDSDGTRFVVGCVHDHSATDSDVYLQTIGVQSNGGVFVQDRASVTTSSNDEDEVAVVGKRSGGGRAGEYLAAVHRLAPPDHKLLAVVYEGLDVGGTSVRTTGCGGLGIGVTGSCALATPVQFSLSSVQGVGGFVAGTPVSLTPGGGCPNCILGTSMDVVVAGNTWSFLIPNDIAVVGVTFAAQGFDIVPVGPCFSQFRASNTIDCQVR